MNEIIVNGMSFAVPLFIIAVGGIYSERSGVTNLALEGFMGAGAFFGAVFTALTAGAFAATSQLPMYLSLFVAMVGGALYAVHNGTISASLFSFATQTKFLIMLMLGGVMSPVGTLFGCVLVNYLPEIARAAASYLNMLYGAMIVLMMIFMPMGLAGIGRDFTSKIRHKLKKKLAKKAETTAAKEGN